jgi:hypothetical protein
MCGGGALLRASEAELKKDTASISTTCIPHDKLRRQKESASKENRLRKPIQRLVLRGSGVHKRLPAVTRPDTLLAAC